MIKVKNEVKVYECNGKDTACLDNALIGIESHWNDNNKIVLVACGERYTIVAEDLICAIKNATNINRF